MNFLSNRQAIYRIAEDRLRNIIADHGEAAVSVPRRLARLLGARLRYLKLLMLEHRLSLDGRVTPLVRRHLPEILEHLPLLIGPAAAGHTLSHEKFRAIVLRAPSWQADGFRRGVLLIKFTETFSFFFHHIDIEHLMRYFRIVLEPSWSGYCLPEILMWARYADPVIVQSSEMLDREFLNALGANLVPIDIGSGDWVDHRVFYPLNVQKSFDVIYVANLTPMKRANVYLRALSEIKRKQPNIRAAIVLSTWGGNQVAFEQMVRLYGLDRNLTVLMNQTQQQLNEIVNRSRVSVLLSRKEGSNKTLFESMFANTPVILLRSNVGVNKSYINEHTGRLIAEEELPAAIMEFAASKIALQPRTWAMGNIAPERSAEKLRAKLAEIGAVPTDMALHVKVNTPEATYMDATVAARMPNVGTVLRHFVKSSGVEKNQIDRELRQLFVAAP